MLRKPVLRVPSCCTQTHLETDVAKQISAFLQPRLHTRRKLVCCVNTNIRTWGAIKEGWPNVPNIIVVYENIPKTGSGTQEWFRWHRCLGRTHAFDALDFLYLTVTKMGLSNILFSRGDQWFKELHAAREPQTDHVCYRDRNCKP
jgi:hypothetical protein